MNQLTINYCSRYLVYLPDCSWVVLDWRRWPENQTVVGWWPAHSLPYRPRRNCTCLWWVLGSLPAEMQQHACLPRPHAATPEDRSPERQQLLPGSCSSLQTKLTYCLGCQLDQCAQRAQLNNLMPRSHSYITPYIHTNNNELGTRTYFERKLSDSNITPANVWIRKSGQDWIRQYYWMCKGDRYERKVRKKKEKQMGEDGTEVLWKEASHGIIKKEKK